MPNVLPITIRFSPLPSDWRGTPQQFVDAIAERVTAETQEALALFVVGPIAPTSNVGPWLKDGTTWMIWSDSAGEYVPQTIVFQEALDPKPFRGNLTAPQTIVFAAPGSQSVDLAFTEQYDTGNCFDGNVFIAPVDGIYQIKSKMAISATSGTPTGSIVFFYLKKNGFQIGLEQAFKTLGTAAEGQTYLLCTDLQLVAGDSISVTVGVTIGGGEPATWTVTSTDTWFSGSKIVST